MRSEWWGMVALVVVGGACGVDGPSGSPAVAATPVFTPAAGTYTSAQTVTISDATPGATIYYTVDGTTPTTSSTPYTGPIAVGTTTTILAIAAATGFTTSAVASATYTIQSAPPGPTVTDWPFYRGDVLGQSFVDQPVTVAAAQGFTVAWTHSGAGSVANPIVVGGIAYTAESNGTLTALDTATGHRIWSQPIGKAPATSCHAVNGPVGAPAVVGGRMFAPGGDGAVHAFAKDTGQPLWSTLVANLSADGTASDDFLWSSAFPLHGRIYVGLGTLGESRCGPTPGRVVALDQATGAVVGTWWVDPQHRAGATIWTQPVYDAATNRLFFTTGQGDPSLPPSSQPTAQAFVAIDADTLQPLDSLQPVSAPFALDYDFGASPTLVDLPDGRRLIVAANKDGFVYAADRNHLSNGVVWSYRVSVAGDSPDFGTSTLVGAAYAHGTLFVGGGQTPDGFAGAVAALDPATGATRWVFHPDGFVLASLLAVGDVVVAQATHLPDYTGRLYVLDQATGRPVFQLSTPGPLYAQATYAAGKLFVSDATGVLYALAPASLQLNGSAALNGTRVR